MTEVAQGGRQVRGQAVAGDPLGEAVEVAAVRQQGVFGQPALGLHVVAKRLDVVHQGGELGGAIGGHESLLAKWRDEAVIGFSSRTESFLESSTSSHGT